MVGLLAFCAAYRVYWSPSGLFCRSCPHGGDQASYADKGDGSFDVVGERGHLSTLAQRVEVADDAIRIMGSKTELLKTPIADRGRQ